ncbi:DUF7065 domain-containing protein [Nocardia sp. R16R-3T]
METWGLLATPIHNDEKPHDLNGMTWRDYALFCWWDPAAEVYVMTHHMSSPDPDTPGRTRVSATVGDRSFEVIEQNPTGVYDSESITLDLGGHLTVDHPQLSLDVAFSPMYQPVDYHKTGGQPTLTPETPLHHYEQPLTARGSVTLKGDTRKFDGVGLRDRSWGYRSESAQWTEYQYLMVDLEDCFLTLVKMKGNVDPQLDLGVVQTDGNQENVTFSWAFNGAGLFNDVTVQLPSGELKLEIVERPAGFWVPMGWRQTGKVLSAFDDFVLMKTSDGRDVAGLATYGVLRQLD